MNAITTHEEVNQKSQTKQYKVLRIDTCSEQSGAINTQLAKLIVQKLTERIPSDSVNHHMLGSIPVEQLNEELFEGVYLRASCRSHAQSRAIDQALILVKELLEANVLVFSVPVYPFGIQRNFKAYMDIISRLSQTGLINRDDFTSTMSHKKVFLITNDTDASDDQQGNGSCHARHLLSFLGVRDPEVFSLSRGTKTEDLEYVLISKQVELELLV